MKLSTYGSGFHFLSQYFALCSILDYSPYVHSRLGLKLCQRERCLSRTCRYLFVWSRAGSCVLYRSLVHPRILLYLYVSWVWTRSFRAHFQAVIACQKSCFGSMCFLHSYHLRKGFRTTLYGHQNPSVCCFRKDQAHGVAQAFVKHFCW